MTTETIPAPRSSYTPPTKRRVNWEKWGWLYMRISGLFLVVLIFGHLFVNLVAGNGVRAIDFAFELQAGERILTEISRKFTRGSVERTLLRGGLRLEDWLTDEQGQFALAVAAKG